MFITLGHYTCAYSYPSLHYERDTRFWGEEAVNQVRINTSINLRMYNVHVHVPYVPLI